MKDQRKIAKDMEKAFITQHELQAQNQIVNDLQLKSKDPLLITTRKRSCGKIMFSQVSFCPLEGGGGGLHGEVYAFQGCVCGGT